MPTVIRTAFSFELEYRDRKARAVFFGRAGGVSRGPYETLNLGRKVGDEEADIAENERLVLAELDVRTLYLPDQVHADGVAILSQELPTGVVRGGEADAAVTAKAGVAVGVLTADCVPILLADRHLRAVAAVHAGWRGLACGVIARSIVEMRRWGIDGSDLTAFIGPAIGPCCYEVGEDLAERFFKEVSGGRESVGRKGSRPTVDLFRVAGAQLDEAGVPVSAITKAQRCTSCEYQTFFSNRRGAGLSGRQLSAIALKA